MGAATAAPRLRLDQTAIGPIGVSVGANPANQRIAVQKIGAGTFTPSAASNVDWIVPAVGASYGCAAGVDPSAVCYPVDLQLKTSGLAKGVYTGIVTVTAPGALDAPQTVTVTVAVGGNVPDQINMYLPVGGTATQSFKTSAYLTNTVTPPASGPTLAIALSGAGSFGTTRQYDVTSTAPANTTPGTYNGTIKTSGSPVTEENKTVPVTLNVTAQPVASISDVPPFRYAQGTVRQESPYAAHYAVVSNAGAGTVTISNVSSTTASGGNWLRTSVSGPYISVFADPSGLAAGHYTGSLTVTTNAANSSVTVPITLDVVPPGPPQITASTPSGCSGACGIVDAATFTPNQPFAQGDLPAIFGEQFTTGDVYKAQTLPLANSANGTTVYLNNNPVPIYYMSTEQINFQVPYDAQTGPGVLRVDRNGQRGNDVYIEIAPTAPKLLAATNLAGQPLAGALAPSLAPIKRGDDLILYALGLGQTNPTVATGAASPSSPIANVLTKPSVAFGTGDPNNRGGITVTPDFAGLTPTLVGLYQVNLKVPSNAPTGQAVPVKLTGALGTSNALQFTIQ